MVETYSATAGEEEKQKKECSEDVEIESKGGLEDQGICKDEVNVENANNAVEPVEITVSDEEVKDFLVGKDDEDIVEETQQLSSRTQIETEDPSLKSYKTENEESIVNILDFAVASSYGVVDDKSSKDLELDRDGKPTDIVDVPKQLEETYSATAEVKDFLKGKDDEEIVEETQQLSSRTQTETEDKSLKSSKTENEESIFNTLEVAYSCGVADDKSPKNLATADEEEKQNNVVKM